MIRKKKPEFMERVRVAVEQRLIGVDEGDAEWAREKWERVFGRLATGD